MRSLGSIWAHALALVSLLLPAFAQGQAPDEPSPADVAPQEPQVDAGVADAAAEPEPEPEPEPAPAPEAPRGDTPVAPETVVNPAAAPAAPEPPPCPQPSAAPPPPPPPPPPAPLVVWATAGWAESLGPARCGAQGLTGADAALRLASTLKRSVNAAGLGLAAAGALGDHPLIAWAARNQPQLLADLLADAGF